MKFKKSKGFNQFVKTQFNHVILIVRFVIRRIEKKRVKANNTFEVYKF